MRKFLISLASILILVLTIYVIISGIGFANVNGYKGINEINKELDLKIAQINTIKESEYVLKKELLDTETSTLKTTREDYLAKVEAARLKGAKGNKLQIEIYELDFIWARIGNYATDLGLEIKLDVFPGTEEKALHDFKLYNLKISVTGAYTDILRFIYKIEGDREISAQISEFSMKPNGVENIASNDENNNENNDENTNSTNSNTSTILSIGAEFTLKNVPLNYKNIMEDLTEKQTGTDINDLNLPEGTKNENEENKTKETINENEESKTKETINESEEKTIQEETIPTIDPIF